MEYSQEFLELKLLAIRESMNRVPDPILPKITKPKLVMKENAVKKPAKIKIIKPTYIKNDGFEPAEYKAASRQEKVFKTKPLNLEEKIKVQVNARTWVYVDPGADIEAIKAKYNKSKTVKITDDQVNPPAYQF